MRHALTVDVEEYFQVSALAPWVARAQWDALAPRVPDSLARVLDLLQAAGARATFFLLGWVAERHPSLVRRIQAGGHEIASHGYSHERVSRQSPQAFLADVRRARTLLQDLSGEAVAGYRAPSFSIGEDNRWAFELLREAGHRYSSSVYPIRHDHYGSPQAPRFAHRACEGLLEIPPATVRWLGRNWPAGGGGFFRLLPYPCSRGLLERVQRRDVRPGVFYFHPWELDPGQPRPGGLDLRTRLRHYLNLGRTEARLRRLLQDFQWDRMDRVFAAELRALNDAA